jgi:chromosome segregation ATPase
MTMVDEEVEIVLREIRERVISQARTEQIASASTDIAGNGDGAITNADETSSAAELARIRGYLTTTARAWDRLPPVISNRSGAMSRLELWLKSRAKSLARWFTWEQVNFNAAVHHALRDTLEALSHQQAAIASLRRDAETRQIEFAEGTAHLAELSAKVDALAAESEARRIDFQNQRSEINTLRAELHGESEARRIQIEDTLQAAMQTELREQSGRLSELANELRERANEQRVRFKQLSLENSEAAAFQTTSRRKLESALAELDQRIKQLEESLKRTK